MQLNDSTVKKVSSTTSPAGHLGQKYLASGKEVSMRLWSEDPKTGMESTRPYETVGYVLEGEAKLRIEGQTLRLTKGDSWLVPAGAAHRYEIVDHFEALEATSPPARVDGRDV